MPRKVNLEKAEMALRETALSYPGAYEEFPWGERAMKVRTKVFTFLSRGDHGLSMSVKLPSSNLAALMFSFASPTGYGLAKAGWVTARFQEGDDVPVHLLEAWMDESYRTIAPKALVAEIGTPSSERSEGAKTTKGPAKQAKKARVKPPAKPPDKQSAKPPAKSPVKPTTQEPARKPARSSKTTRRKES